MSVLQELLGEGKFGKVYKVTDPETKEVYIEKVIKITDPAVRKMAFSEVGVLEQIKKVCNPYLLCVKKVLIRPDYKYLYIRVDYVENGIDLWKFLNYEYNGLSFNQIHQICTKLLRGLITIHDANVVHRDIKEENILLVPETLDVRYIDYGLGCVKTDNSCIKQFHGSIGHSAPELIKVSLVKESLNFEQLKKCDIWSLGIVFFSLILGTDFWENDAPIITNGKFAATISQEYVNDRIKICKERLLNEKGIKEKDIKNLEIFCRVINGMLQINPNDRTLPILDT